MLTVLLTVLIAEKFAKHFESNCSPYFSSERNMELKTKYVNLRMQHVGSPIIDNQMIDVELTSKLISKLANGQAAELDEISGEHLKFSHPILVCILTKLFNLFILKGHIPSNFGGASYTVPIPKRDGRTCSLTVNDFRGISISHIISKLFEMALLQWRIQWGRPPPIGLTNFCINVKIILECTKTHHFQVKIQFFFWGGCTVPSPDPSPLTVRPPL